MAKLELVDIKGSIKHETAKAYLFVPAEGPINAPNEIWLPKSKCEWDVDAGVMTMESWIAENNGLV